MVFTKKTQNPTSHLESFRVITVMGSKKRTLEEFVARAKEKHGELYDYSQFVYIGSSTPGIIVCKNHGPFLQRPNNHLLGNRCKKCTLSFDSTTNGFINRAKEVHGDRYDYSQTEFLNCSSKVKIICRIHGEFFQQTFGHISGRGCPICGGKHPLNTKIFIERAIEKHGDHLFDYSKVNYTNTDAKVEIICKKHGSFLQRAASHLKGMGCRKCLFDKLSNITISKAQIEFLELLEIPHVNYRIGQFIVDGLKDNCVYEFLGDYWHSNPLKFDHSKIHPHYKKTHGEVYNDTFNRLKKIADLGYSIKYIWESDWNSFKRGLLNLKIMDFPSET